MNVNFLQEIHTKCRDTMIRRSAGAEMVHFFGDFGVKRTKPRSFYDVFYQNTFLDTTDALPTTGKIQPVDLAAVRNFLELTTT